MADRVVFTGRVPHAQVQRYYDLVDVLAYPRHSMRLTELVTPLKPLEAMAQGGAGCFVFSSTRLHPDYDPGSPLRASQAPGAFPLVPDPQVDPRIALLLPYGKSMARFSAIANVTRGEDGVLRDIPLRETLGNWAVPSLPLRLAATAVPGPAQPLAATVRPNWRQHSRLPRVSAAAKSISVDPARTA